MTGPVCYAVRPLPRWHGVAAFASRQPGREGQVVHTDRAAARLAARHAHVARAPSMLRVEHWRTPAQQWRVGALALGAPRHEVQGPRFDVVQSILHSSCVLAGSAVTGAGAERSDGARTRPDVVFRPLSVSGAAVPLPAQRRPARHTAPVVAPSSAALNERGIPHDANEFPQAGHSFMHRFNRGPFTPLLRVRWRRVATSPAPRTPGA
jgi:hypothetical protein